MDGVVLDADVLLPHLLRGHDERARDVPVLRQSFDVSLPQTRRHLLRNPRGTLPKSRCAATCPARPSRSRSSAPGAGDSRRIPHRRAPKRPDFRHFGGRGGFGRALRGGFPSARALRRPRCCPSRCPDAPDRRIRRCTASKSALTSRSASAGSSPCR